MFSSLLFLFFNKKNWRSIQALCFNMFHLRKKVPLCSLVAQITTIYLNIISINVIVVIYGRYKGRTSFGAYYLAFISCCLHNIYTFLFHFRIQRCCLYSVFLVKLIIKYLFKFNLITLYLFWVQTKT